MEKAESPSLVQEWGGGGSTDDGLVLSLVL